MGSTPRYTYKKYYYSLCLFQINQEIIDALDILPLLKDKFKFGLLDLEFFGTRYVSVSCRNKNHQDKKRLRNRVREKGRKEVQWVSSSLSLRLLLLSPRLSSRWQKSSRVFRLVSDLPLTVSGSENDLNRWFARHFSGLRVRRSSSSSRSLLGSTGTDVLGRTTPRPESVGRRTKTTR